MSYLFSVILVIIIISATGKVNSAGKEAQVCSAMSVTIHGCSKHHAKNHPAMPSGAAKTAAFVFLMIFRTAYTLILENNQPLTCKHDEFDYFLKPAMNSNL